MSAPARPAALLALLAVFAVRVHAQESPGQTSGPPSVFRAAASVVVLDLVVRDKKGRSVTDLEDREIEVFENGVRCEIRSFRLVQGEPFSAAGTEAATVAEHAVEAVPSRPRDTASQINVVTLLFDHLGPNGRALARNAALTFLESPLPANAWISVFLLDQSLTLLQPFTNDRSLAREAVVTATSGTRRSVLDETEAYRRALDELDKARADAEATAAAAGRGRGEGGGAIPGHVAAAAQARVLANVLRMSRDLQRQQQGETSLYPLLALMKGQSALEGRKTMLYFSEGLAVTPSLDAVFRAAVSEANRANVSVYAVDARGLDPSRQNESAKQALEDAVAATRRAMQRRGGAVEIDEVLAAETAESGLRLNVQGTLADLSESTGGFLMADTNDFRVGMERLASDVSTYYEVTYVPPSAAYDGKFRSVSVKVARKGVRTQARSGYFALPTGDRAALLPYEVPLFAALESAASPRAFDYQASALRFGGEGDSRDHLLVVEVPLRQLTFRIDEASHAYALHFSLLALVKDRDGRIVERFSVDYPFRGPAQKVEALKLGNVVFKRTFRLPPAHYELETVAADAATGAASVSRQPIEVPPRSEPALSTLSVIRRLERAPPGASEDPFELDGVRIVPNLDAPIPAASNASLSLFFTVYPKDGTEAPTMVLEFIRDGKVVARAVPELPARDEKGRIAYVGTFPIRTFAPGRYEVRAEVRQGAAGAEERGAFTIVP